MGYFTGPCSPYALKSLVNRVSNGLLDMLLNPKSLSVYLRDSGVGECKHYWVGCKGDGFGFRLGRLLQCVIEWAYDNTNDGLNFRRGITLGGALHITLRAESAPVYK